MEIWQYHPHNVIEIISRLAKLNVACVANCLWRASLCKEVRPTCSSWSFSSDWCVCMCFALCGMPRRIPAFRIPADARCAHVSRERNPPQQPPTVPKNALKNRPKHGPMHMVSAPQSTFLSAVSMTTPRHLLIACSESAGHMGRAL